MKFEILAPLGAKYNDVNDYSVVLRIDYGESSFLMTGDAEKKSEEEMLSRYSAADLDCDVLKAGHHGSRTSSSDKFLKLVTPKVVLISCGEGNSYGHPHSEVMMRFEEYVVQQLFRTDKFGDIVITTDGEIIKKGNLVLVDESGS
jgi:competence protein ComEC